MKKLIYILLFTLLMVGMTGCTKCSKTNDKLTKLELSVATPSGAPAIAFYNHLLEDNLEINSEANNVVAYLSENSNKDIVVAPTNAGIQAIVNKNAPFKIAAVITFGNFYLVSTGLDDDGTLNNGDSVLAFQENGVAGKLFKYVYGDLGLNITYLADVKAVKTEVLTKDVEYEYVLLAEPVVSAVLSNKTNYQLFKSVQEDYKIKSNGLSITQAAIFVNNKADENKVKALLSMIKEEIEALINDSTVIESCTSAVSDESFASKLGGSKVLIQKLIFSSNKIGIGFEYAYEFKTSIDSFIQTLGINATNEETYFRH